ncbi:MAG: hypothetical protein AABX90_02635 [Nanoarchaeota archaeon]
MGKFSPNYKKLNSKEIKVFLKTLNNQFGFTGELSYLFFQKKDKIYILSKAFGSINPENFNINSRGLYIATTESSGIRLSIEGSQLIGPRSNKNIINLDSPDEWLQGKDIENKHNLKSYAIIKYKDDFIGCGFCKKDKILNYIPKSRRLK